MMAGANVTRRGEAVALFFGAPELAPPALDGMLDGWKTLSKPAKGASPTTRSSARLSTS